MYCWVVFDILSTTGAACRLPSYNQPSKFILWPRDIPEGPSSGAQAWLYSGRTHMDHEIFTYPDLDQNCSICFCTEHLFKLQSQPCHGHCQSTQVTSTTSSACKALQGAGTGVGSACPLCASKPPKHWRARNNLPCDCSKSAKFLPVLLK